MTMYEQPSPNYQPVSLRGGLFSDRRVWFIGGGAVIAIILAIVLLNSGAGGDIKTLTERLSVRYDNLAKLTQTAGANIQDAGLLKVNAEAEAMTTSDDASVAGLVKTRYGSVDGSITQAEADTSSATTLSNAVQLNTYDTTYKSLLADKLNNALLLVDEIIKTTGNPDTLSVMKQAQTNLRALEDRLSAVTL